MFKKLYLKFKYIKGENMSNLKIEKKYNKFLYCDTYYIYFE